MTTPFDQTQWHGLKKKEFEAVRCATVVGDLKEDQEVVSLHERKANSAASGNYLDAHAAKMSLKAHFEKECVKRKSNLIVHYKEDLENLDIQQLGILANFNADAERQLQEYDARAEESLKHFADVQKEAHAKYMEKIQAETLPLKPRWSPEVLKLRKVQGMLLKQCEYTQAHMRRVKADELEAAEKGQWEKQRNRKIKVFEEHFLEKQRDSLTNAKKKIASARQELINKQKRELERLHTYGNNHKTKVKSNHKVAVTRAGSETSNIAYARQLCGYCTSSGLRP